MSAPTAELNELESIEKEIYRLTQLLKPLRKKKRELETRIYDYIEKQGKPGIKYKGKQILPKTTSVVDRSRSKKIKEQDGANILTNYGLSSENSETIIKEIMEAMRGPRQEQTKLTIKKL